MRVRVEMGAVFLSAAMAFGQQASGGHFASFKELLRDRIIDLSQPSLTSALRNSDSHVRYLAALVLAEDGASGALHAIKEAFATEKVPETRVNMALALAQLGDEKGSDALRATCADAEVPQFRIYAAKYLLDLGHEDCLGTVVETSQSSSDLAARVLALSLLPRFRHASSDDSQRIVGAAMKSLQDAKPEVRMTAGDVLKNLGNASAISSLELAIAREHDETVRSRLQLDLEGLKEKRP